MTLTGFAPWPSVTQCAAEMIDRRSADRLPEHTKRPAAPSSINRPTVLRYLGSRPRLSGLPPPAIVAVHPWPMMVLVAVHYRPLVTPEMLAGDAAVDANNVASARVPTENAPPQHKRNDINFPCSTAGNPAEFQLSQAAKSRQRSKSCTPGNEQKT